MKTIEFPNRETWPALGLGTWHLGEAASRRAAEVAAVRVALEIGYRVFDSAEMYGEGGAEEVLGEALAGAVRAGVVTRDEVFVVSKVYPHNASRGGVAAACRRSLQRLGLDRIDLYLLHWRGAVPLADTLAGFVDLQRTGHIRHWGVSNLDLSDMEELSRLPGGDACATDQVYYALAERGPEFDLLPWLRGRRIPLMAYSPLDQGALAGDRTLAAIGERHRASAAQVALAWVLAQPGVMAIPQSARERHLRDNYAAASLELTQRDLDEIDRHHPSPKRATPLAMR
ncbi:MAG: aldo/keto reductase [Proteobacteria bacterium]|nr:aldo/keto reductase [Pseudomonadota bacterium]